MLLWKEPVEVHIQSYSAGHIDCIIQNGSLLWRFTGFYGNPVISLRYSSWQLLRRIASIHELKHLPWVVGGDFNDILYDSEKMGGVTRPFAQLQDFADAIADCGLQDLSALGNLFTWCNRRQGEDRIFARLDRFLCNFDWNVMFP